MRAKEKGVTVVVITQRPALLNIVDKVLILRGGRAEAFGPPHEVLRRLVKTGPPPHSSSPRRRLPQHRLACCTGRRNASA